MEFCGTQTLKCSNIKINYLSTFNFQKVNNIFHNRITEIKIKNKFKNKAEPKDSV